MNVSKISKFISFASLILIFPFSAFASYGLTTNPSSNPMDRYLDNHTFQLTLDDSDNVGVIGWILFDSSNGRDTGDRNSDFPYYGTDYPITYNLDAMSGADTYHLLLLSDVNNGYSSCNTYANCLLSSYYLGTDIQINYHNFNTPIPPVVSGGVLFGTHYPESGSDGQATTTGGLLAAVGMVSTNAFSGIFPYLMLSVGVFVGFYIIQQIVMTLGRMSTEKAEAKRSWSGEGLMEHDYTKWRKKARSRKKRGLDIK